MGESGSPYARLAPRDRQLLFEGPLTPQDLSELERRAETEPEIARALVLMAPLGARFHRRVLRSVRPPETRKFGVRVSFAAALVAAAAVLFLAVAPREPERTAYQLELEAGWRIERSGASDPRRHIEAGAPVLILARPVERTTASPGLAAFVLTAEGWVKLEGGVERSSSGVLRLRSRWPEAATEHRLTVVIAPESAPGVPGWLTHDMAPPSSAQVEELNF